MVKVLVHAVNAVVAVDAVDAGRSMLSKSQRHKNMRNTTPFNVFKQIANIKMNDSTKAVRDPHKQIKDGNKKIGGNDSKEIVKATIKGP